MKFATIANDLYQHPIIKEFIDDNKCRLKNMKLVKTMCKPSKTPGDDGYYVITNPADFDDVADIFVNQSNFNQYLDWYEDDFEEGFYFNDNYRNSDPSKLDVKGIVFGGEVGNSCIYCWIYVDNSNDEIISIRQDID